MKAERAAAAEAVGSWSDCEQPSLSYEASDDEEECMPLVTKLAPPMPVEEHSKEDDVNNLKPNL